MKLQDIHAGKLYRIRRGRSILLVRVINQVTGQLVWRGKEPSGRVVMFQSDDVIGEFVKPSITLEGMKPVSNWHLLNRVKNALSETPVDISDFKQRLTNKAAPLSFTDAIIAALEYVEIIK